MSEKVKTAVEIAEERAAKGLQERTDGRVEMDVSDFKITPQEKTPSHVVKQAEAGTFDENKQTNLFKDDKQTFSRIKDVRAEGHMVIIDVDEGKRDDSQAAILQSQKITPQEALQRATALNTMLMHEKINVADVKQVQDIVEAAIAAVLEAQENIMISEGCTQEDIKRARKARLDKIEAFEAAVRNTRGAKELAKLQEMQLFKKVLKTLSL